VPAAQPGAGSAGAAQPRVVVLDYGSGNVHSAAKALEAAGARVELTRDRSAVMAADGLVRGGGDIQFMA